VYIDMNHKNTGSRYIINKKNTIYKIKAKTRLHANYHFIKNISQIKKTKHKVTR